MSSHQTPTEVHWAIVGSDEHRQALDLRTAAFFIDHGGRETAAGRDQPRADHPVIIEAGRVIACGQGHISDGAYHITQMAVDQSRQGSGLGRTILIALIARARERNLDLIQLEARAHVVDFYRRHDFKALTDPRPIGQTGVPHVLMERRAS